MDQQQKNSYFEKAKNHLASTIELVKSALVKTSAEVKKLQKTLHEFNDDDKIVMMRLLEMNKKRADELELMDESPYFNKCFVNFDKNKDDIIYIGKFSFSEENIYSWISPIAKIRFEKPGNINYIRPDKTQRDGILMQKDQCMITNGQIMYLSTESIDSGRELVYQDYFSNQKKDFVLPEIVAQMEKAQDSVIRASHRGSLLISGPAGSGKTTLALHRVAYLVQSPDVMDKFNANKILVLVQDVGTKEYFSHLLPDLGIKGISINTFSDWAISALDIVEHNYQYRIGEDEREKDDYEFSKIQTLNNLKFIAYRQDIFGLLAEVYSSFDKKQSELLNEQRRTKTLDRFDLTILVKLFSRTNRGITIMQEYYKMSENGSAKKMMGRFPVEYDLIIFDEFQNYLSEQIRLVKSCRNKENNSIMYVGDVNQQTQLGTTKNWSDINEQINEKRQVVLDKVYRNTKQILEYIRELGYKVNIARDLKEGDEVIEKVFDNWQQESEYVSQAIDQSSTVGILAKDKQYLKQYKEIFKNSKNVHVLSMDEAQGVEFEVVFLVGINKESIISSNYIIDLQQKAEKQKIDRDLLYVALTRAINNLYVLGSDRLSDVLF